MADKRIYLSPPHMSGQELELIKEVFDSNWIAPLGPMVDRFESEMCSYTGVSAALATSSATAALHLALRLCGVQPGDIVFCSSFTFIGSINPIAYLGAKPVFIDSEPESWNMSPLALEKAFREYSRGHQLPRAVLIVNLYGQSASYRELKAICDGYEVPIVEDAAESLGAQYMGQPSGTFGKYGVFSFNGNKIITTSGGGMLISKDENGINKARFWSTQAREPFPWYEHREIGYNYRLSNILAAVGVGQLENISQRVASKKRINGFYRSRLEGWEGIGFMPEAEEGSSNCWLTVITFNSGLFGKTPVQIAREMEAFNIETRPVWKPMHLQPVFGECPYYSHWEGCSFCDQCFATGLCLPSGSGLSDNDLEKVVNSLIAVVSR